MSGHFRKGTPNAGLYIVLGIPPLDLYIKEEIMKARIRIEHNLIHNWNGKGNGKRLGRIKQSEMICADAEVELTTTSQIATQRVWDKKYSVNTASYANGDNIATQEMPEGYLRCYTDGSRMNKQTGLGYCLLDNWGEPILQNSVGMAPHNTVHQAETKAIELACIDTLAYIQHLASRPPVVWAPKPPMVDVLCDSRSTLESLRSTTTSCQLTSEAISTLNKLSEHTRVTLHWIKAHVDHAGNEKADELAKIGATMQDTVRAAVSKQAKKTEIKASTTKKWNERWRNLKICRQTKIFFPIVHPGKSKKITKLSRPNISTTGQVITGHNFLNRPQGLIDKECGLASDVMTLLSTRTEDASRTTYTASSRDHE
jgi:hypothetical protein